MGRPEINNFDNKISDHAMAYPKSTLHELFVERALLHHKTIALEFDANQITYDELEKTKQLNV